MAVNANTQAYNRAIDRAAMIRLYEKRTENKVSVIIDGHTYRVDQLIKNAHASPEGFKLLQLAIDEDVLKTVASAHTTTSRSLMELVSDQVSYGVQGLEKTVGRIWKPVYPTKRVAEDVVLKTPLVNNKTLEQGWAGIGAGQRQRIAATIRKGIAEGHTLDEIAFSVRKGNVHNITRAQSKALVTTAVTSVTAQADHAVYEANKGVLRGYQYVAVLDSRTSSLCSHRDGTIYPVDDVEHLPPAHYNCRSTTVPVFKSWDDLATNDALVQIRKENLEGLTKKQRDFYDGLTPMRESYQDWLQKQPVKVQLRHLGDYRKVELLNTGRLNLSKFTNAEGRSLGIKELRELTDDVYAVQGDTLKFAAAKEKLEALRLGISRPEDLMRNEELIKALKEYYLLQAGDLDGTLSLTNYRGTLLHNKKATRSAMLTSPPSDDKLRFNPITGRYEDVRLYQPNQSIFDNNLKLLRETAELKPGDIAFIESFVNDLAGHMSMNERSVVMDNLRIVFTRYRKQPEPWLNFKAVLQSQIKFDVMNVSDAIETQIRQNSNVFKKLLQDSYIDPVLGPVQLDDLSINLHGNIMRRNRWEDTVAPEIARELRGLFDTTILKKNPIIWERVGNRELEQFYLRFAKRLSLADSPDRDQLAMALGRDLYNLANLNGTKNSWYELGMELLESRDAERFFTVETFGVQKRRMKSRLSSNYFGPYYDTLAYNIRVTDKRILEYSRLNRAIEIGMRVPTTDPKKRLVVREGYKTYFIDRGLLGFEDTRIPVTSVSSYSDFPVEFMDKSIVDALNWASKTEYTIDEDYFDFIRKLLYFEDDKGAAKYYNSLNGYRKFIAERGDAYERFKAMEWLRKDSRAFSNTAFIDHRARVYDRGLIGPQSGETFRPFLNTKEIKNFDIDSYDNLQDQIGAFLGGLSDKLEGNHNSLTITGRQKIAEKWRSQLIQVGYHMRRAKPGDIRAILESELAQLIDGEELGKFFRFAIEMAKIDEFLGGNYTRKSLERLSAYRTAFALEQDASSSGAQIIALTTKNKQLAELSNVVPTNQKRRLYDEIAAATYNDPRFREMNKRLGLSEKDLRKAAKAQNMVTFYGAGERTGIMNVEGKLAKVLSKDSGTLVVTASEKAKVLDEISAQIAKMKRLDPDLGDELVLLRSRIKEVFDKGLQPGDELMDQLYFLNPETRLLVEKLSKSYERVVTPDDFKRIAEIMSEHLGVQVPILKDFTRFFGRLAEDYLKSAKPSKSDFDWKAIGKTALKFAPGNRLRVPDNVAEILGMKRGETIPAKLMKRVGFYNPNGILADIIFGPKAPNNRRTGAKFFKVEIAQLYKLHEIEIFTANKLPKSWTNIPWVNFDGKIIEQTFTQSFEERLLYRDAQGRYITNILQVPQKTESTWWEQTINASGKMNDIADINKARTAYAVNGNHSNDATIVKQFHLWGKRNNIATSTIHDAFFANAADMLKARAALRESYAEMATRHTIKATLDEMRARGLPKELYDKYLNEATELGLIPVVGRSRIGGRLLRKEDILTPEDILKNIPEGFKSNRGWYGVG